MRVVKLCTLCIYGPEDAIIGAMRRFNFGSDENAPDLRSPESADTVMLTSRRSRRKMAAWLRKYE